MTYLLGMAAILALICIPYYAVNKIGALITKRDVEIEVAFVLAGAFIGMLFLPSSDHATTQSRLMLAAVFTAGAFVGGLVGFIVDVYLERKPKPKPRIDSADGEEMVSTQKPRAHVFYQDGELLVKVLFALGIPIYLYIQFSDRPFLSPIIQFLRHLL
jgi:outer membrane lipoprotein SlyB